MKKCPICGMVRKITIECKRCGREVCLNDFHVKYGVCVDCETIEYNKRYYEALDRAVEQVI